MNLIKRKYSSYKGLFILSILSAILIAHHTLNPFYFEPKSLIAIEIALLIISLWITELIPMPITSILPIILFPLSGLSSIQKVCQSYADPVIFLFMGGFFLALAIEKWNLHKRMALTIIKKSGFQPNKILLGFMLSTFLISMWISNTATTMMMYPIGLAILHVMGQFNSPKDLANYSIILMLSIAYASNFGGLTTIVGTPPNSALVTLLSETKNLKISFIDWFKFGFPFALIILFLVYFFFNYFYLKNSKLETHQASDYINQELLKLGRWTSEEKIVMFIFSVTALFWILKDLLIQITGWPITDTTIALMGSLFLFIIPTRTNKYVTDFPSEETANRHTRILNWQDTKNMAWGVLLMFGGGLALAKQLEESDILNRLANSIVGYGSGQGFLLILLITIMSIFLSEIMSNIAQVIVLGPIIISITSVLHLPELSLSIPMCLAASCASMLPMGTPPNAIVFGSGLIPMNKMIRIGLMVNLICILVIVLGSYYYFLK